MTKEKSQDIDIDQLIADGKAVVIEREPKKRHKVLRWFGRFFMLLGVMAFLSSLSTYTMIANLGEVKDPDPDSIKNGAILTYHFRGGLSDTAPDPTLSDPFASLTPSMHDVAYGIREAAKDDKVKALAVRISGGNYSFSEVMEIRDALADYRATGKKAYAFASSFGDFNNGMMEYMLAMAFDEIWLQPMGQVTLSGFHAEIPFFKDTMDKLGIKAQIYQRKEYKTAPESMLRTSITPENTESMRQVLDVYDNLFMEMVATSGREIDPQQLQTVYRGVPMTDQAALQAGYVDRLGYVDELVSVLEDEYGLGTKAYRNVLSYIFPDEDAAEESWFSFSEEEEGNDRGKYALIFVEGAIMDMKPTSHMGPMTFLGGPTAGALSISSTIRDAADDDSIDAIILRVNSPGGSPSASETLRRAVVYAQEQNKKVYLSMGGAAASGGYWMSANADYIMAYPSTLTGSIGVFGGKISLKNLWDKIGVNWAYVAPEGDEASTLWSQNRPYNAQAEAAVNDMLDMIYTNFVSIVADGRGKTYEDAEKIARGRVWTGQDALDLGLVDGLGSLEDLIAYAASDLAFERDNIDVVVMPRPLSPLESFLRMLRNDPQVMMGGGLDTLQGYVRPQGNLSSWLMPAPREGVIGAEAYRAMNPLQNNVMQPAMRITD